MVDLGYLKVFPDYMRLIGFIQPMDVKGSAFYRPLAVSILCCWGLDSGEAGAI